MKISKFVLGNFLVAVSFYAVLGIIGCGGHGGAGGGGETGLSGNWDGAWSDSTEGDTGTFSIHTNSSGSGHTSNVETSLSSCGSSSGTLKAGFTTGDRNAWMDTSIRANDVCVAYTVKASTDNGGFYPYNNGHAAVMTANYFRGTTNIGSITWGVYVESSSGPDAKKVMRRMTDTEFADLKKAVEKQGRAVPVSTASATEIATKLRS